MPTIERQRGFTLVELMVVLAIIGVVLVFLIPRAYRASVESKYQLLRQTSTELASWANEWAEKELEIQSTDATSTLNDYMETLGNDGSVDWVGNSGTVSNWQGNLINVSLRDGTTTGVTPNTGVKEIMPQAKILTNPFNGLSVFSSENNPADVAIGHAVTGAIGCAYVVDGAYNYYALLFQGTESIGTATAGANIFYAGQDADTLAELRNGIFIARLAY